MIKGFRQIASLTAVSRVLGFLRDIAYSHFFGANALLDAWTIAFKIPNLARRLFGEGAASASLIPVYSQQLQKDPEDAKKLVNTIVTILFVALAAIVLIGQGAIWTFYKLFSTTGETKLVLSLTSVMLPYMLMVCIVAILAGILNVHRHFAAPAAAPIILNIFIIGTILLTGWVLKIPPRQQLFFVAAAVLIAGITQIALQLLPLRAAGVSIRPAWDVHSQALRKIIILMGPMILGLTATQINTLSDDLIAWWLSASVEKGTQFILLGQKIAYPLQRGSVSHLYFAQRLYQLPLGIFGISLATAIFPVMSSHAAKKDFTGLAKSISTALRSSIFIALPASVGLIMVAKPLILSAFQHGQFQSADTDMTVWTLSFYAIGLCGYFAQQLLARAFFSMQDSKTPTASAMIAVCANIVLNLTLIWFWGTGGLACSTALCSYLQVFILARILRKRLGSLILDRFIDTLAKTLIATALMSLIAASILVLMKNLPDYRTFNILKLIAVVPSAAAVYLLAAKFLRIELLSLLTGKKIDNNQIT
jgi:putative peptidoglycan lipid II flippase